MYNYMNYYDILGVNKNSPIDDIKKSYKKLAVKYHPDKGGDTNKFIKICEAYEILYDPIKKEKYDNNNLSFNTFTKPNDLFNFVFDINDLVNEFNEIKIKN